MAPNSKIKTWITSSQMPITEKTILRLYKLMKILRYLLFFNCTFIIYLTVVAVCVFLDFSNKEGFDLGRERRYRN